MAGQESKARAELADFAAQNRLIIHDYFGQIRFLILLLYQAMTYDS